jgi:hypothetical protein
MGTTQAMLEAIRGITGSLGPMGSWEARLAQHEEWEMGLTVADIPTLKDVLLQTPAELEGQGLDAEEVYVVAADALGGLGDRAPAEVLAVFRSLLPQTHLTTVILDGISVWGSAAALDLLAEWMDQDLREGVTVSLACALGEIGGGRAMEMLRELEERYPGYAELGEEIAIARANHQDA